MTKIERTAIAAYAARHDAEKFRVTHSGEVHIFGPMPNAIAQGWWFAGYAHEILCREA